MTVICSATGSSPVGFMGLGQQYQWSFPHIIADFRFWQHAGNTPHWAGECHCIRGPICRATIMEMRAIGIRAAAARRSQRNEARGGPSLYARSSRGRAGG